MEQTEKSRTSSKSPPSLKEAFREIFHPDISEFGAQMMQIYQALKCQTLPFKAGMANWTGKLLGIGFPKLWFLFFSYPAFDLR